MSELIKFIKENKNWKDLLQQDPYSIIIDETGDHILLKYNQIKSKFKHEIVQECRGCIIDKNTLEFVCRPFDKFFNYGESLAHELDLNSIKIQEKCDGSLIKLWWDKCRGHWQISTMGKIISNESYLNKDIVPDDKYLTFLELVLDALPESIWFNLNKEYTYMFELMSPYNRVVVPHKELKIKHLGTRHNQSGQEVNFDIGIEKPKTYSFSSLEDVVRASKELPFDDEGYIVVDKNFKRVKVKSLAYVSIHSLFDNGNIRNDRVLNLVKINEHGEFLSYYPEYTKQFKEVEDKYSKFIEKVNSCFDVCKDLKQEGRKVFAKYASKQIFPSILFKYYDGKFSKDDVDEFFKEYNSKKLLTYLDRI